MELGLRVSFGLQGRTIWIVDGHRDDGERSVVHADEILTAFVALRLSSGDKEAAEHLLQWAECMARTMIEKQWPSVQRLAYAVIEKEKFTGNGVFHADEIRQVLGGNGRNGSA